MPASAQQGLEEDCRHGAAPRDVPADHARSRSPRTPASRWKRTRSSRIGDLANSVPAFSLTALTAARPGTEHPRHHQHASRLADGRPVGRHVRRRRVHRPHRRLQLRLLRPRAHRGHPRPAGRAARQERRRWRAQRHHRGARRSRLRARRWSRYGNYNSMLASRPRERRAHRHARRDACRSRAASTTAMREDVLHHRDVEDLESFQARAQLLWEPDDSAGASAASSTTTEGRDQRHQHGRGRRRHEVVRDLATCAPTARARGATCARISASPIRARTSRRASQYTGKPRIKQFMERDGLRRHARHRERGDSASRSTR